MKTLDCPKCGGTGKIPDQKSIGDEMRQLRIHAGISLRSAASKMGFSASYLSDLENGHRNWDEGLVEAFKEAIK
jgi:transcriptional regulator with XRE-family HTH domain